MGPDHPQLGPPEAAAPETPPAVSAETFALIVRGKQEWERAIDAIEDPIALQRGFAIVRCNKALASQGNIPVREVPGKTCHELLAHRPTPCPGCPLTGALQEPVRGDVQFSERRTVQVSCFPSQRSTGEEWVIRHHDVTAEKAAAIAMWDQERLAAVSQLAAGAAHEINNPLTYMITNLSLLGDGMTRLAVLSSSLRKAVDLAAEGSAEAVLQLLRRFRGSPHLSALEALAVEGPQLVTEAIQGSRRVADIVRALGRLTVDRRGEPAQLDLLECAERALQTLYEEDPALRDRSIEWGPVQRLPVLGLGRDLEEAVLEIVRNAFRHGPSTQPIRIGATIASGQAILRIEDQGPGMTEQLRSRIFEPFFTTSEPGAGTGLGLTVAYSIIRQNGGHLQVRSSPGSGTTVDIALPLARLDAGTRPAPAPEDQQRGSTLPD